MLLQALKEYAARLPAPPPTNYGESPVRYVIDLDDQGQLLSKKPTDTADRANPKTKWGKRLPVPQIQRSSGIKPLLLADKADYTFGLTRDETEQKRAQAQQRHQAYIDMLERCAHVTLLPEVEAVDRFLKGNPLAKLDLPDDFDASALITFRVNGAFPTDLPLVQAFWAGENDPAAGPQEKLKVMQCLICGKERPALERLQGKVKGIRGGQTSGTSIISANAEAFLSYGLEASLIAPTCAECGEAFTRGINALLSDHETHLCVGGSTFAFWTREPVGFSPLAYFDNPKPEDVRALFEAARTGRHREVDAVQFYCASFSPSGGRVAVRDWIDTTVGETQENLRTWFDWQQIVDPYGSESRPLGIYGLSAATVRDLNKELSPLTPRMLLHSALTNTPLPMGLLYQAVRRNRAEQNVSAPRATLIKMVLASRQRDAKEDSMIQLDPENINPAYRCGRLLAVLERVQNLAIPGAKTGIVDRFYGTASSAPASVFGRLLRGAQPHLGKLQRTKPGVYRALQTRLEDIQSGLAGFPRTLTLEEQGLFALGYYHQRAYDRAQAKNAKQLKDTGSNAETTGEAELEENEGNNNEEEN